MNYHTALKLPNLEYTKIEKPVTVIDTEFVNALVFNVEQDVVPEIFQQADFIFLDIPYAHGYSVFNVRANREGKGYKHLIECTYKILQYLNKPFFFGGPSNLPIMKPFYSGKMRSGVHNSDMHLYTNSPEDINIPNLTRESLLESLFDKYNVGLDFMCGYGSIMEYSLPRGKRVILSDYNESCIGKIYEILSQKKLL